MQRVLTTTLTFAAGTLLSAALATPSVVSNVQAASVGDVPAGPVGAEIPGGGSFGPMPCGQYDDGTSENALGLTAGGEMGWLHRSTCQRSYTEVETAYGASLFPGTVTNGAGARVAVYADPDGDGDPNTGLVLLDSAVTVVVNGNTDILNPVMLSANQSFGAGDERFIMATADHTAGQFPGPMDQDNPTPEAWVVGSTLGPGTLDIADLTNNNVPPMNMTAIGLPAAWLLREGMETMPPTCVAFCFGDGSSAPCGCGNEVPTTFGGCANGLGVPALLTASGNADTTSDTVVLSCTGVRAQPGLFFQGDIVLGGGNGMTFGDGIRCCGQNVVRLEIVMPSGPEPATAMTTVTISQQGPPGTVQPGECLCYQYWYRDPNLSPCNTNFNFSNGLGLFWN